MTNRIKKNMHVLRELFYLRVHGLMVFRFDFIPQNPDRDKELTGRDTYFMVFGKSAAGNNAVHMHMA